MKQQPTQMEELLKTVGGKLGVSPEQLRADLESGKVTQAIQNLPKKEAAMMQNMLGDSKKLEKLMNAPQAKALYEKLMGQQ